MPLYSASIFYLTEASVLKYRPTCKVYATFLTKYVTATSLISRTKAWRHSYRRKSANFLTTNYVMHPWSYNVMGALQILYMMIMICMVRIIMPYFSQLPGIQRTSQLHGCTIASTHEMKFQARILGRPLISLRETILLFKLHKFGQLILRKITEIVATRCKNFIAKMHQIRFRLGLSHFAYSTPQNA